MSQNVALAHGDVAIEPFFDATQEMLSGGASNFKITVLSDVALRVPAGVGEAQASISVDGRYRYRTTNEDRSHPGGAAGVYDLYVTAEDNNFTGVSPNIDITNYSFSLAIVAAGAAPTGVALSRLVGAVDWDGSKITGLRQFVGSGDTTAPLTPTSPNANVTPLRARAHAAQAAPVLDLQTAAGASLLSLTAAGGLVVPGADGLVLSGSGGKDTLNLSSTVAGTGLAIGGDVTLYRSAANVLSTDDSLAVGIDLTVAGTAAFTGVATGPTAAVDTNTTQLATTAYVVGQGYLKSATAGATYAPLASPAFTGTLTIGGDVNLYRSAANALKTDDAFHVENASGIIAFPGAGSPAFRAFVAAADANPYFAVDSTNGIRLGPGGATVLDINLYRSGPNTLKTDDNFYAALVAVEGSTEGTVNLLQSSAALDRKRSRLTHQAGAVQLQVLDDAYTAGTTILSGNRVGGVANLGFFGVTPVTRRTGWSAFTGATARRTLAAAYTMDQLRDVVDTLRADLAAYGLIGA